MPVCQGNDIVHTGYLWHRLHRVDTGMISIKNQKHKAQTITKSHFSRLYNAPGTTSPQNTPMKIVLGVSLK